MKRSAIFILLLLIGILAACGGREEEPQPTPTTAAPVDVPTSEAEVVLPDQQTELTAQPWAWVRYLDQSSGPSDIDDPQNYEVAFLADGSLQVRADCNNAAGSYTAEADNLTITLGPTTLAICAPESRSEQFLTLLGSAAKYQISGGQLQIDLFADAGTLFFAPASTVTVPPTAVPPTSIPQLPGGVVDNGPSTYASGVYQPPYYIVAAGDTLYSISQRFGISMAQISAANGLVNNAVYPNQQLLISSGGGANPPAGGIQYEQVTFAPGSISATLTGVINNGQPTGYALRVQAGQTLEIGTTSNGEPLELIVQGPDGSILPLNGENSQINNNTWLPIPASGDYYLTVRPTTLPESPSLAFTITFVIQ